MEWQQVLDTFSRMPAGQRQVWWLAAAGLLALVLGLLWLESRCFKRSGRLAGWLFVRLVSALAAPLVKPGGRLIYVTCSVLPEENEDTVAAFLAGHAEFGALGLDGGAIPAYMRGRALQFTPLKTGCDGFFVAALQRAA